MKLFKMTKKLQKNFFFENAVSSLKLNENSHEHKNIQDPIKDYCKISISPQYFNYQK